MDPKELSKSASAEDLYFKVCVLYEAGSCKQLGKIYEILKNKYPDSKETKWSEEMLAKCRIRHGTLLDYRWGYVAIAASVIVAFMLITRIELVVRYILFMLTYNSSVSTAQFKYSFGLSAALWVLTIMAFFIGIRMLLVAARANTVRNTELYENYASEDGKCPKCSESARHEADECEDCGHISGPEQKL